VDELEDGEVLGVEENYNGLYEAKKCSKDDFMEKYLEWERRRLE
jgi:hypothetical protein